MEQVKINAFGAIVKPQWRKPYKQDLKKTHIFKIGLELDKETGSTTPVVAEEIDSDELIQSYKDQCGLEAAMKLIRSGQVSADHFADDGQHGGDLTAVPDYAGDLLRARIEAEAQKKAIQQAYGLTDADVEGKDLDAVVNAAVEKKLAEIQAKAGAAKEGE